MSDWPQLPGMVICATAPERNELRLRIDGPNSLEPAAGLEALYPWAIEHQLTHWELDLRPAQLLQSRVIGAIVGMNTRLTMHKGALSLLVQPGSHLARMFSLLQIQRLMNVIERPLD